MKTTEMRGNSVYPFSAIVGQERVKTALLLNVIDPNVGGVLITGSKGSGKSTLVRALTELLPEIERVQDCRFNCNPQMTLNLCPECQERLLKEGSLSFEKIRMRLVELPLSVSEDRLLGSLDVEEALKNGVKALMPGLVAEANRNILYIDEVNLLSDYLINSILDPAASGWNVVQREGFSISHPARFTLIASMNPEEGDLRPQILDRFALSVKMENIEEIKMREKIVRRNMAFEDNPTAFRKIYQNEQQSLLEKLTNARKNLSKVKISDKVLDAISEMCANLRVDGFRPDLSMIRAARAYAALKGMGEVRESELLAISDLALMHRTTGGGGAHIDREEIENSLRDILFKKIPAEDDDKEITTILRPTEEEVGVNVTIPQRRRSRRRQTWILPPIVHYLLIIGLFIILLFFSSISILFSKALIFGVPSGGIGKIFALDQLLITMGISGLGLLTLWMVFPPKTKRQGVFFYQSIGTGLRRRIVQVQRQRDYPPDDDIENRKDREAQSKRQDKLLNVPLYATMGRLYRLILNRGPSLLDREESDEQRYAFNLRRREDRRIRSGVGKNSKTEVRSERGRYVSYEYPKKRPWDIALGPTLRAAAPYQRLRPKIGLSLNVKVEDIRVKVRESRAPLTVVLLLDMSESMATSLANIRNTILSMHDIAYKMHDQVGLIVFKGATAVTLQSPTRNLSLVVAKLKDLGASDLTPLAAGMFEVWRLFRNEKMRNRDVMPILVIISDGITNVSLSSPLSPFTRQRYLNHAQADVIDAAYLLEREGVQTLIVNPSHVPVGHSYSTHYKEEVWIRTGKKWLEPTELLMQIPNITGGYYYGIKEGGELESVNLKEALGAFTT